MGRFVALPSYTARGRFLFLLEGRSLPLHHHSLCIFLRNYAKDRGENISTRHRYLTSLMTPVLRPPRFTPRRSFQGVSREFSTDSSSTLNVYYAFRYKSSSHSQLLFSRSREYACFRWLTFVFFCPIMVLRTFARKDTMESQVLEVIDRRLQKSLLD